MTGEKLKIKVIKRREDLEKVVKGDVVMFNFTANGVPVYGVLSYKGEESVALIQLLDSGNPDLGEVAWKLSKFSALYGMSETKDKILPIGDTRYPFRVGSEEYENYKSKLEKFDSLTSDKVEFAEI